MDCFQNFFKEARVRSKWSSKSSRIRTKLDVQNFVKEASIGRFKNNYCSPANFWALTVKHSHRLETPKISFLQILAYSYSARVILFICLCYLTVYLFRRLLIFLRHWFVRFYPRQIPLRILVTSADVLRTFEQKFKWKLIGTIKCWNELYSYFGHFGQLCAWIKPPGKIFLSNCITLVYKVILVTKRMLLNVKALE